jgi:hypothetical protein
VFRPILRPFLARLRSWRGEPRRAPDLTPAGRAEAALRDAGLTTWHVYEQDGVTYATATAAGRAGAGRNPAPHADRVDAEVWACVKALMRAGLHGRPDPDRRGHVRVWE